MCNVRVRPIVLFVRVPLLWHPTPPLTVTIMALPSEKGDELAGQFLIATATLVQHMTGVTIIKPPTGRTLMAYPSNRPPIVLQRQPLWWTNYLKFYILCQWYENQLNSATLVIILTDPYHIYSFNWCNIYVGQCKSTVIPKVKHDCIMYHTV